MKCTFLTRAFSIATRSVVKSASDTSGSTPAEPPDTRSSSVIPSDITSYSSTDESARGKYVSWPIFTPVASPTISDASGQSVTGLGSATTSMRQWQQAGGHVNRASCRRKVASVLIVKECDTRCARKEGGYVPSRWASR